MQERIIKLSANSKKSEIIYELVDKYKDNLDLKAGWDIDLEDAWDLNLKR